MTHTSVPPVSRRAVAKGAAWSLPVVAFAASAPAARAWVTADVCVVDITGVGVKTVNGKTVTLTFSTQNYESSARQVTIVSVAGPANTEWSAPSPASWQAAPGISTQQVTLTRANNANGDAVVTLLACGANTTTSAYVSR